MKNLQIKTVGLLILFAITSQFGISQSKNKTKPNIVFIAIDDMNTWIGAMGGDARTPNIDKLAGEGKLFTNAQCVVPACNPSRVAILTGVRPETSGQYTNPGNFRDIPGNENIITLPKYLLYLLIIIKIIHKMRLNYEGSSSMR